MRNAILIFIVAVTVLVFFVPSFSKLQDLRQKNMKYENQIGDLRKKNVQLTEEQRLLQDDPVYLEKVAREKMGLAREGEVVYKIVPASGTAAPQHTEPQD